MAGPCTRDASFLQIEYETLERDEHATRILFGQLVVETAQDGDKIAIEILNEAGFELGLAACAVIEKLKLDKRTVPIGCVGSIFNAGNLLTEPMLEKVRTCAPKAFLTEPAMPPSHAAALMAHQASRNGNRR